MTATDELRRMLDERGVEYTVNDEKHVKETCWPYMGELMAYFVEFDNGTTRFELDHWCFTPEQAIAATLGDDATAFAKRVESAAKERKPLTLFGVDYEVREECENIAPDYLDFLCSACGFVHYHSDENDTGDGNDWAYCPRCGKAVKR